MFESLPEEITDLLSTEFKIRTLKRNIEFDLYIGEELLPASERMIHYPLDDVPYEMGETAARIDDDGVLRYCRIKTHLISNSSVMEYEVQTSGTQTTTLPRLVLFKFKELETQIPSFNLEQLHKVIILIKQLPLVQHRWLLGLLQYEYKQYDKAYTEIMQELRITSAECPILLLPNELLLKIIEYLNLREIARLARTCKYLSRRFAHKLRFKDFITFLDLVQNDHQIDTQLSKLNPILCAHCLQHCPKINIKI